MGPVSSLSCYKYNQLSEGIKWRRQEFSKIRLKWNKHRLNQEPNLKLQPKSSSELNLGLCLGIIFSAKHVPFPNSCSRGLYPTLENAIYTGLARLWLSAGIAQLWRCPSSTTDIKKMKCPLVSTFSKQNALDKFCESFIPVRLLNKNYFPEYNLFILLIYNRLAHTHKKLMLNNFKVSALAKEMEFQWIVLQ